MRASQCIGSLDCKSSRQTIYTKAIRTVGCANSPSNETLFAGGALNNVSVRTTVLTSCSNSFSKHMPLPAHFGPYEPRCQWWTYRSKSPFHAVFISKS